MNNAAATARTPLPTNDMQPPFTLRYFWPTYSSQPMRAIRHPARHKRGRSLIPVPVHRPLVSRYCRNNARRRGAPRRAAPRRTHALRFRFTRDYVALQRGTRRGNRDERTRERPAVMRGKRGRFLPVRSAAARFALRDHTSGDLPDAIPCDVDARFARA